MKARLHRLFLLAQTTGRLLAQRRWDLLAYGLGMRLRGFDLSAVDLPQLGLDGTRAHPHGSSGGPDLERVLRQLDVPPGSRILDFGSGKGGAMLTLAAFPFVEIFGVELSSELVRIAEANCARADVARARFYTGDATSFTELDRFTHFYLYHSFPCAVLAEVCANLQESLRRTPRPVTLIYKNPGCHDAVIASGLFSSQRDFDPAPGAPEWTRFRVYFH